MMVNTSLQSKAHRLPERHVVSDLYIVLYDAIEAQGPANVDHGIRGYYFGENGEHSWYDISKAIGRAMVELGLSDNDEPTPFTVEELKKYFGSEVRCWPYRRDMCDG